MIKLGIFNTLLYLLIDKLDGSFTNYPYYFKIVYVYNNNSSELHTIDNIKSSCNMHIIDKNGLPQLRKKNKTYLTQLDLDETIRKDHDINWCDKCKQ